MNDKKLPRAMYFRHGAYYHVRHGKWTRLGATLREALPKYAAIIETPTGEMAQLIDEAMAAKRTTLADSTAEQYAIAARRLKKIFREFQPRDVKSSDIARLKIQLAATPNYANQCISLLRVVFDHALELELVDSNPARGVKRHKVGKRTRLLELPEFQAIHDKADERLKTIMDLCALTGQRVMDVVNLRREHITPAGVFVEQQKTGARGVIAWTPELRAAVARCAASGPWLFPSKRGRPPGYRTIRDQWARACRAAGVQDANLHDLRAMAATMAKRQGRDATALLMHTSPAQTARYLRDKEVPVVQGPQLAGLSKNLGLSKKTTRKSPIKSAA